MKKLINDILLECKKFITNFYFNSKKTTKQTDIERYDVIALGNAVVDFAIKTNDDNFAENFNLNYKAMNPIALLKFDEILNYFQSTNKSEIDKDFCGSAANTLRILNKLSVKSVFVSCIGEDVLGEEYLASLEFKGGIRIRSSSFTSKSIIIIDKTGERTMCSTISDRNFIDFDRISTEAIFILKTCKVIIIEGYLFYNKQNLDAIEKICIIAKVCGVLIFVLLSDKFCVQINKEQMTKIINQYANYIVSNQEELTELMSNDNEILPHIAKIITMDKDGAKIEYANFTYSASATVNTSVVDSTGAGDAFLAGFLEVFCKNLNKNPDPNNPQDQQILIQSLHNGNKIAAKVISKIGTNIQN